MDNNNLDASNKLGNSNDTDMFSNKNFIITMLMGMLLLSFLGINILTIIGSWIQTIISIFGPLVTQILSIFGYTAGTVIVKTADVAGDVAKGGIDIAEGTLHSIGGLLKNASQDNVDNKSKQQLDKSLNKPIAEPDIASNPIQNPITSNKISWCLVGDYQGRRGCIEVTEQDKCLSGQVFPTQKMCLNPTFTANTMHPLKPVNTQ